MRIVWNGEKEFLRKEVFHRITSLIPTALDLLQFSQPNFIVFLYTLTGSQEMELFELFIDHCTYPAIHLDLFFRIVHRVYVNHEEACRDNSMDYSHPFASGSGML